MPNIDDAFDTFLEPSGGGGSTAQTHAFKLSDATTGGVGKVRIKYGTVNNIAPTGMTPVDGLVLSVLGDNYVVLVITVDSSGFAQSAVISLMVDVPDDTSTTAHIALGYVTLNAGPTSVTVSQLVSSALWQQPCGDDTYLFGTV